MEKNKEIPRDNLIFIAWIVLFIGIIGFYKTGQITRGEEIISLFLLAIIYKLYSKS